VKKESEIALRWDHAKGGIEIQLPSGSRILFTKQSDGMVFSFLNALHMMPREKLREPISQDQVNKMVAEFFRTGGVVIASLREAPKGLTLEELGL
jgi:hypothetical protein